MDRTKNANLKYLNRDRSCIYMSNQLKHRKPFILITNDDSVDSPLLAILINTLKQQNNLLIVAPAEEQSWKGKSMTRRGYLEKKEIYIGDTNCWAVNGTPADCANIGIHNIAKKKPDFVVSGINIGKNIGVGFALASGTIGACIEANIAGIPAIALSQEFFPEDFKYWDVNRAFSENTKNTLLKRLAFSVNKVLDYIKDRDNGEPLTWNVNFPKKYSSDTAEDTLVKSTVLSNTYYDNCFKPYDNGFQFALAKTRTEENKNSDVFALEQGAVSVSKIDVRILGQQLDN